MYACLVLYATGSSNLKLNTFSCTCYRYFYIFNLTCPSVALSEKVPTAFYCPAPVLEMQRASKVTVPQHNGSSYSYLMKADFQPRVRVWLCEKSYKQYPHEMNVIIMWDSMYNLPVKRAIDKRYLSCVVSTGGELPGLSFLNVREEGRQRHFLCPWKEQWCHHALVGRLHTSCRLQARFYLRATYIVTCYSVRVG